MSIPISFKRGSSAALSGVNPLFLDGEPVYETDTFKLKIGDGTSVYNNLPFAFSGVYLQNIIDDNSPALSNNLNINNNDIIGTGNINISGDIFATSGNSNNWNTAYSWGDHSSVGYLTDITSQNIQDLNNVANSFDNPLLVNEYTLIYDSGISKFKGSSINLGLIKQGTIPFTGYSNSYLGYYIRMNPSEFTVNEQGADLDFRVEGDSNANLLFTDASADRVGIGTNAPAAPIHLVGPRHANFGSFLIQDSTNFAQNVGGSIVFGGKYNSAGEYARYGQVAALKANSTDGNTQGVLSFSTNDGSSFAERMRILPSGNVAFGSTGSDFHRFSIRGNINQNDAIGIFSDTAYGSAATSGNVYNVYSRGQVSAYTLQNYYHFITTLPVLSNGAVINNELCFTAFNNTTANVVSQRGFYSTINGSNSWQLFMDGTAPSFIRGNVGIGTSAPTNLLQVEGGNVVFNDAGGNFDFRVEGDTDANLLFTDASTDRVGIGTSSPTHKLHVAGSGYMDWTQLQSNYYINYPIPGSIAGNSNRDQIILFAPTGVATLFRGYIDSNSTATSNEYLRNFSRTFIHYRTSADVNTVPQVTVNGVYNGNQSDLAANDNGRVVKVLHSGVEYWGLIMQDLTAFQSPGQPVFNGYASSLTNFQYGHRDGFTTVTDITPNATAGRSASLFRYQNLSVPDGNVGVGTNNPTSRLHVEGGNIVFNDAGGNFDFRVEGDTDTNLLFVDASNDSINIGTGSSTGSKLYVTTSNATNYSSILSSGDAGSQSSLMRVSNTNNSINDSFAGLFISVRQPSTSTDQGAIISCLSSTEHIHTPHIVFGSRSGGSTFQELMRISSSGNVGIDTNSPTEKLDINSDAIRIRTAQTPASGTATGNAGDICWDSNYIYVCVATNTWKRSSLASW